VAQNTLFLCPIADRWTPTVIPLLLQPTRAELESEHPLYFRARAPAISLGLLGLEPARLPVMFVGHLTCQLTFPLYLAVNQALFVKPVSLVSHRLRPSLRCHSYPAPSHTCSLVLEPCMYPVRLHSTLPTGPRVHVSRLPTSRCMPCSALRTCALCQCLSVHSCRLTGHRCCGESRSFRTRTIREDKSSRTKTKTQDER
jgi:hypothetical protein